MKVYPVAGLLLRDPVKGDLVPAEGREVADSPYWFRRLECGDASLTPPVVATGVPVVLSESPLTTWPSVTPESAGAPLEDGVEASFVDGQADDAGEVA